jgi:protein subunit release factor B
MSDISDATKVQKGWMSGVREVVKVATRTVENLRGRKNRYDRANAMDGRPEGQRDARMRAARS